MEHPTPTQVVNEYLTSFYSGDFSRAAAVLAVDFSFQGPFLSVAGRDAFLDGAQGLRPVVQGHRLLRQWQDGDEVCSISTPHHSGP